MKTSLRMLRLASPCLAGLLVASGCGAHLSTAARIDQYEEGQATWYGPKHHGGPTASGERYNMHELTAAHRYLRMGTRVSVRNLRNGRSVIVRINDRGPYGRGRIIDLSYAAAQKLDMIAAGVVPVRVQVVQTP